MKVTVQELREKFDKTSQPDGTASVYFGGKYYSYSVKESNFQQWVLCAQALGEVTNATK